MTLQVSLDQQRVHKRQEHPVLLRDNNGGQRYAHVATPSNLIYRRCATS